MSSWDRTFRDYGDSVADGCTPEGSSVKEAGERVQEKTQEEKSMSHIMDNELTEDRYHEIFELTVKAVIEEMDQDLYENDYPPLNKHDKLFLGIIMHHLADTGRVEITEPKDIPLHEEDDSIL